MTGPKRKLCLAAACLGVLAAVAVVGGQAASIETLVSRAADYVDRFQVAFSSVVAEERYEQNVMPAGRTYVGGQRAEHRELRSDFLLVRLPESDDWVPFRDVFTVDNRAVRDHEDRLVALFMQPGVTSTRRAAEITEESARYNIGVTRTVNHPLLALNVLRRTQQARFRFSGMKPDASVGPGAVVVDYREMTRPSIIRGPRGSDLLMHGRLWLDGATGTILRTEIMLDVTGLTATIATRFVHDATFGVAIPVEMNEEYIVRNTTRVTGTATYGRFRSFKVSTTHQ
jgi:hypothetical protein